MNAAGVAPMFWFTRLTAERKRTIGHWLMELVIVVAGVLIALWLQQWGEGRKANADMKAAEASVHEEARGSLENLLWRQAINQCHLDRAGLLKRMLLSGSGRWPGLKENTLLREDIGQATGVQLVMPGVYARPNETYTRAAWTSALATGALAPMDRDRFAKIAALYAQIEYLSVIHDHEDRAASVLSALTVPQDMTADTRTRMLQALYEIDASRFMYMYVLPQYVEAMDELGWDDRSEIDRFIREDEEFSLKQRIKWRPCVKPMTNPFRD